MQKMCPQQGAQEHPDAFVDCCRFAEELRRKQEEHERALKSNAIKLQALLQQTRRVKDFVENTVSGLCNNRTVHIIGDINKVI